MEGGSKNGEKCPQLLNLIPKDREWLVKKDEERSSEEKKLELRLGPPGDEAWSHKQKHSSNNRERDESLLYLSYFSNENQQTHKFSSADQNPSQGCPVWFNQQGQQVKAPPFLQIPASASQSLPVIAKESSQACCTKVAVDLQQSAENKTFSPPAPAIIPVSTPSSQKRTAPGPVVGWPPIRSFRKNLASTSSSKQQPLVSENGNPPNKKVAGEKPVETCSKGLFVKINMDGVPIGRKVDLKAYDSYEKLSAAVDELFRGLLAAQRDSSASGIANKQEEEKAITGVLEGSGEYTLVYEDNEGDRMLVGDVPWHMFVSTVKRLRVLKSSEVSALTLGSAKQATQDIPLK